MRTASLLAAATLVAGLVVVPPTVSSTAHADDGSARAATRHLTAELVRTGVPYTGYAEARGVLTDDDPSTGPLAGVRIVLYGNDIMTGDGSEYFPAGSTTTDADGAYALRWRYDEFVGSYLISTDDYGSTPDAPKARPGWPGWTSVVGHVSLRTASGGRITTRGGIAPRARFGDTIELYAGRPGREITYRGRFFLKDGAGVFGRTWKLAPGPWNLRLRYTYRDGHDLAPGTYSKRVVLR